MEVNRDHALVSSIGTDTESTRVYLVDRQDLRDREAKRVKEEQRREAENKGENKKGRGTTDWQRPANRTKTSNTCRNRDMIKAH